MLPDHAIRLLRAFPDAAMFVSARGQIFALNSAARQALGVDAERPSACELASFVDDPSENLPYTLRTWARTTDPAPGSFTLVNTRIEGTFNAKGALIFTASEQAPAVLLVRFWPRAKDNPFVLVTQKLTELNDEVARRSRVEEALRRSEIALRERAAEAESLNRTKDEFLATLSHELRTPLNAIVGWSNILQRRSLDPQLAKPIEVIHRNALSQAKLIDDILDVSRIITGKLRLEIRPTDLTVVLEEAIEVIRPSAAAKQIEIVVSPSDDLCVLVADPERLRQAAWNLLSNAVKFTSGGGTIHVDMTRRGSHLCLTVTDSGCGIAPAFLPSVFDRFRQADGTTTRRAGGLGLGLAIVRHIVELHGGSVEAFSEGKDKGARFTITLPVRAVAPPQVVDDTPSSLRLDVREGATDTCSALQGLRVLVVDDEPDARELVAEVLRQAGAQIETAASAAEGLRVVPVFRPHVLVSDIGMPDEDGYSFVRRLRDLGAAGAIPSIALTAYTRGDDRTKALSAGFTTHIGKPVRPDDLVAAVGNLTHSSQR